MTLVDPNGVPLRSAQGIPVICQGFKNGTLFAVGYKSIRRAPSVEAAAERFIAQGGRYRVTILPDDTLHFAATVDFDEADNHGQPLVRILAAETAPNGPEHLDAVDRVVLASVKHFDVVH